MSKCGVPCTEVDFALELNISSRNTHYKQLESLLYLEICAMLYFESNQLAQQRNNLPSSFAKSRRRGAGEILKSRTQSRDENVNKIEIKLKTPSI